MTDNGEKIKEGGREEKIKDDEGKIRFMFHHHTKTVVQWTFTVCTAQELNPFTLER